MLSYNNHKEYFDWSSTDPLICSKIMGLNEDCYCLTIMGAFRST